MLGLYCGYLGIRKMTWTCFFLVDLDLRFTWSLQSLSGGGGGGVMLG